MSRLSKARNMTPRELLLGRPRRGYCVDKDGLDRLVKCGLTRHEIYLEGNQGETIERCINWFREPGDIIIANDLRIFGKTRKEIIDMTARIGEKKLDLTDITHPEDGNSIPKMIGRALTSISAARFQNDRRGAKRAGRTGGKIKGEIAAKRRNEVMATDIVRNICTAPELTWARRLEILCHMASKSTLIRRYVTQI